jgi:uncharacterized protein
MGDVLHEIGGDPDVSEQANKHSMSLYEKITTDMRAAMKSGDRERLDVLRFSLAGLNGALKERTAKDPSATLGDDDVVSILQKEAKRRKESIELFRQGNREDLAAKEESELAIIAAYLPAQFTHGEIVKIVGDLKQQGFADFNSLMRETSKAVKGRADGKMVMEIVKEKVSR